MLSHHSLISSALTLLQNQIFVQSLNVCLLSFQPKSQPCFFLSDVLDVFWLFISQIHLSGEMMLRTRPPTPDLNSTEVCSSWSKNLSVIKYTLLPLYRQPSCLHHYSHGHRKFSLVPNFRVPACSLTSWVLILSTGGMESIHSFRCARIYVSSWLVSLHSCNVSSRIVSSRPLTSLISSAAVACFPNATDHINTAVKSGIYWWQIKSRYC